VNIQGNNTIQAYSVSRTWAGGPTPPNGGAPNSMCKVILTSNAVVNIQTQADINRLILDLNAATPWQNNAGIPSQVRIRSANQPTGTALTALGALNTTILTAGGIGATVFT
jgi:hypothetical protein